MIGTSGLAHIPHLHLLTTLMNLVRICSHICFGKVHLQLFQTHFIREIKAVRPNNQNPLSNSALDEHWNRSASAHQLLLY